MPKVRSVLYRSAVVVLATAVIILAAQVGSMAAQKTGFTTHDLAYYLNPQDLNFIRPGVVVKIKSASVADDGTITVRFTIADPKGVPLDKDGIQTPGPVSFRYIAAYIAKGKTQYTAYTTTVLKASIPGNTNPAQTQAGGDSGGTTTINALGDYTYVFKTKAPSGFDKTVTHTIGITATRDLSEFMTADEWAESSNDNFNFVPDGSKVTVTRDVVRTATCNKCHDPLFGHGGTRLTMENCILCHQPQTVNPDTLESMDMPVLIHKIHMGKNLPSVQAGKPYRIWHRGAWSDFSEVGFPTDPNNCQMCHESTTGAAQADAWLKPSRAACGSCHDNVNFATGENHVNLPQVSDNLCANCHMPQGEIEYDTSVKGSHLNMVFSQQLPGNVVTIMKVDTYSKGQKPLVTFSLKDKKGNVVDASTMNTLNVLLTGPSTDYSFYKSESAIKTAARSGDAYTYQMTNGIPADATGTYTIAIEAYKNFTVNAGTVNAATVRDSAPNVLFNFSVDGSKLAPRRTVVTDAQCNTCHGTLMLHGGMRRNIQFCPVCHNPNQTDVSRRATPDLLPAETINFKSMIHKIHRGSALTTDFTVYGYGNSKNNYNEVGFPGDLRNCDKCHTNNSYQLPLPDGVLAQVSARDWIKPSMQPAAAACLSCHDKKGSAAHANLNTDKTLGESCDTCHGPAADFSIDKVHAR